MGKKSNDALASSCFLAGLFLGIFFLTGTSIDPSDLMGMVAQAFVDQISPVLSGLVALLLIIVSIVGYWQTYKLVASGSKDGLKGLVMTLCCFFGGVLLVFSPIFAIVLIIIGFGIANLG